MFQGHSWYPGLDETLSLKKESFPKMTNITDAKIYMKQRKLYKTSSQEKKKHCMDNLQNVNNKCFVKD